MTTIDLVDTNSSRISSALVEARRRAGSPTTGQVLTLVVSADEGTHYDSLKAALDAAREHPSRILVVIDRGGRGAPQLDAEIRVGEGGPGDTVILRLHGQLAAHADSVVLPLLLPDAPVVVWWPTRAPDVPAADPLGRLAQRRLTDAAAETRHLAALARRSASYQPGDTDLAWTRLTPWRALLAACLDQQHRPIESAEVEGERGTPSAELLAAWLSSRLGVEVVRRVTKGPGLTAVRMVTSDGPIQLSRPDGRLAQLDIPGSPPRPVALRRRTTAELLAEELRRLDPDDVYESVIRAYQPAASNGRSSTTRTAASGKPWSEPDTTAKTPDAPTVGEAAQTSKTAVKKAAIKNAAVTTTAAARRTTGNKTTGNGTTGNGTTGKNTGDKQTADKQTAAKNTAATNTAATKSTAKKAPAKQGAAKKTVARKTAAKKTAANKTAGKTTAAKTATSSPRRTAST